MSTFVRIVTLLGDFEFVDSHDSSHYSTDEEAAATAKPQSKSRITAKTAPSPTPAKESGTTNNSQPAAEMKPEPMHVDEAPLPDIIGNDG